MINCLTPLRQETHSIMCTGLHARAQPAQGSLRATRRFEGTARRIAILVAVWTVITEYLSSLLRMGRTAVDSEDQKALITVICGQAEGARQRASQRSAHSRDAASPGGRGREARSKSRLRTDLNGWRALSRSAGRAGETQ